MQEPKSKIAIPQTSKRIKREFMKNSKTIKIENHEPQTHFL
jgi:hypothetical protein